MKYLKRFGCIFLMLVLLVTALPLPSASAATANGLDIVNCARSYIGKVPYVWGGETIDGPNPGADCSGFLCRIFEKYGFNFWKHRTNIAYYGDLVGTDFSYAKPGDVVWYSGHIALFSGWKNDTPMIVHCTGGKISNVTESSALKVSAALKGIYRIPGVIQDGESYEPPKASASFSKPTDPNYTKKVAVQETSASLCLKITKSPTTAVTVMGIRIYNEDQQEIKSFRENVSVGKRTTVYHSWYDTGKDLKITLVPGTTYYYRFFGIFNGQTIQSDLYSFTTKGTKPTLASFQMPTQREYCNKIWVRETNAGVCLNVRKNKGVKVTGSGIILYTDYGDPIKQHSENVGNVRPSSTSYHIWYDIQKEVGVTLTPGTLYYYQLYGVFNGTEVFSEVYSFKTTGTAPVPTVQLLFRDDITGNIIYDVTVPEGQIIDEETRRAIEQTRINCFGSRNPSDYQFEGWVVPDEGEWAYSYNLEQDNFYGPGPIDLYPQYTFIGTTGILGDTSLQVPDSSLNIQWGPSIDGMAAPNPNLIFITYYLNGQMVHVETQMEYEPQDMKHYQTNAPEQWDLCKVMAVNPDTLEPICGYQTCSNVN